MKKNRLLYLLLLVIISRCELCPAGYSVETGITQIRAAVRSALTTGRSFCYKLFTDVIVNTTQNHIKNHLTDSTTSLQRVIAMPACEPLSRPTGVFARKETPMMPVQAFFTVQALFSYFLQTPLEVYQNISNGRFFT